MRLVMGTPKLAIYDDVFENEDFNKVWEYVQQENYANPHSDVWKKVWRLTDYHPLGSPDYCYTRRPFNSPLDLVCDKVVEGAKKQKTLVGSWNEIVFRCYLYPRGTKLSWHNDYTYTGACIYYAHPKWASTWGGELMVAEMPKELPDIDTTPPHLDHRWEDAILEAYGTGTYVTAKPNRLVYTSGSVWHAVNRIDDDAGDHVRCTIVCFFQYDESKGVPPIFPGES